MISLTPTSDVISIHTNNFKATEKEEPPKALENISVMLVHSGSQRESTAASLSLTPFKERIKKPKSRKNAPVNLSLTPSQEPTKDKVSSSASRHFSYKPSSRVPKNKIPQFNPQKNDPSKHTVDKNDLFKKKILNNKLLRVAKEAYQQGEFELAEMYLNLVNRKYPTFETLGLKAELCMKFGSYQEAISVLDQALKKNPYDTTCLALRAKAFYELNEFDQALVDLNKILESNPSNVTYLIQRADVLFKLNLFDLGLVTIKNALSLEPDDQKLLEESARLLSKVLEHKPDQKEFIVPLATILFDLKKYDDVQLIIERNVPLARDIECIDELKVKVLIKQKKYDTAFSLIMELIKKYPKSFSLYNSLGIVYKKLEKYDHAIECFKQALQFEDKRAKFLAYAKLSEIYFIQERYKTALKYCNLALQIDAKNVGLIENKFRLLICLEDFRGALVEYNKLPKQNLKKELLELRISVLLQLNEFDLVIAESETILNEDKDNYSTLMARAYSYKQKKEYRLALKDLFHINSIYPSKKEHVLLSGEIFYEMGKYSESIDVFKDILKAKPKNKDALLGISKACLKAELFVQGKRYLEEFLKLCPQSAAGLALMQKYLAPADVDA